MQTRLRVKKARPSQSDQQYARKTAQRGIKTRLPVANAQPGKARGIDPGLQRRLLKVQIAVIARREPITACQHFTRHFSVAAFIARNQMADIELRKPKDCKNSNKRSPLRAATRNASLGHFSYGTVQRHSASR